MANKKYRIQLTEKQRKELINLTRRGESKARQMTRARVLLLADENRKKGPKTDDEISDILNVSLSTISRIRRQFVKEDLMATLDEKPRSGRPKVFLGRDAAQITALACSDPPEGHAKWSLRLIADKAVELEYIDSISYQTVFHQISEAFIIVSRGFSLTSKGRFIKERLREDSNIAIIISKAFLPILPLEICSLFSSIAASSSTISASRGSHG